MDNFANQLQQIHNQRLSGELTVTDGDNPLAFLYFYSGRLVHSPSYRHRVRRLYRALKRHSNSPQPIIKEFFEGQDNNDLWDFNAILKAMQMERLGKDNAKNVVQNIVHEVFYNIVNSKKLELIWSDGSYPKQPIALLLPEQALQVAQNSRSKWLEAGLGHVQNMIPNFSLDMSAMITDMARLQAMVNADAIDKDYFQTLVMLLNGQNTIWDLAIMMQKSLIAVMRNLLPLVVDGIVEFQEVPDLPAPVQLKPRPIDIASKGLVACIDDSPQIGKELTAILQQAGYDTMFIIDPLQGMSELLKRKPDLIFLDLVMPNTNGYEFCTFLRKTSQFKEVPIVILTGNDGVIDRVRAKIVGASDFMGKPPEASKVLQMVQKYIQIET
jgi:Response regulator containing a CheY-like receiver domain and a GGDEF domain